jgi:hypothetical protein
MHNNGRQRVFPLHLTPLERLLRADDRAQYPMTFVLEMVFSGTIDRAAFEVALAEAVARHPLLVSHILPAKGKVPCWVSANGQMPVVDWKDEHDLPFSCPDGEGIDLRQEVGLRIWVRQGSERTRLITQFHHACCDGVGAYQFLGDLLALYSAYVAPDAPHPKLRPIDLTRLRHRAHGCMEIATSHQFGRQARSSLSHAYEMLIRGCTPLRPATSNSNGQAPPFPGIHSFTFDQAEHRGLRQTADHLGVTLNDLLLHELFCLMHDWNTNGRSGKCRQRFRVMVPVCLRERADFQTPASNIIGYSFITRRSAQLHDSRRHLQDIREEMAQIKHRQLAKQFIDTIAAAATVPGLLSSVVRMPRTMATAVFSNLGDPTRRFTIRFPRKEGRLVCGNLILEDVAGIPPMRPRTRATFLILSYNLKLTINVRCDPQRFTSEDTQNLLSLYKDRLLATAAAVAR